MTRLGQVEEPKVTKERVFRFTSYAIVKTMTGGVYAARIFSDKPITPHGIGLRELQGMWKTYGREYKSLMRGKNRIRVDEGTLDVEKALGYEMGVRVDYLNLGQGNRAWNRSNWMSLMEIKKMFREKEGNVAQSQIYMGMGMRAYKNQMRRGRTPSFMPEVALVGNSPWSKPNIVPKKKKI